MSNDDNLLEYWDDVHPAGRDAQPVPREPGTHPGDLVIGTSKDRILIRIHPDGTLTYGPEYTPDEAAVEFWTQMAVRRLESEERVIHLGMVEQFLQRLGAADLAYEASVLRARRPDATEHDRYMSEISHRNLEAVLHQTIEFARGLVARPDPPPPVEQLMRPGYRPGEPFVHRQADFGEEEFPSPYCVCGAPWSDAQCTREAGIFPPARPVDGVVQHPPRRVPVEAFLDESSAPAHAFCTSGEASPWHHDHTSEPHCQCGAPWEDGRCSFVAASS